MSEEVGTEAELPEDTGKVDLEPIKEFNPELYDVVNRRLGTMYGVTKELRKTVEQQGKDMRTMFDKLQGMEDRGKESERQQILDGIKSASEEGDHEKVATLTDRLTKLNSNSKGETAKEPADKPESSKGEEKPDLSEFLSSEDEARLVKWTNERDSEGNLVRPWLQESHPKYKRAMAAAQAVMADESLTPAQMMTEIDSLMGTQRVQPNSPVLTPGTPQRKGTSSKPKATPEQRRTAEAMGVNLEEYMGVIAGSESYPDGTMVKILELED